MAAALHDAGWYDHDLAPHLVDGEPAGVLDTTREEWAAFYDHGIAAVTERDPYAGLLCAMHGAGVRKRRYGTHADLPDSSEEFAAFIERQEARQRSLVDRLLESERDGGHVDEVDRRALEALHAGDTPEAESGVFRNYRLLQTWDRLSLYCCSAVDHGTTTMGSVPVAPGEPDTELSVVPVEDPTDSPTEEAFEIEPYPFDESPVTTRLRTRAVGRDAFDAGDESDLVRAYYDAPRETVAFGFTAAG
jgi:hypothetical protein